jgi:hypothetical protein
MKFKTATLVIFACLATASQLQGKYQPFIAAAMAQSPPVVQAPLFEVDPFWPKPLPNHWVLGSTIGLSVDERDHVWILHRPESVEDNLKAASFDPPIGDCCIPAPPVLEFDQAGNLVSYWGGPGAGYEWPQSNHGITVDHQNNVWIGANGNDDTHILKFTNTGNFIFQLGKQGTHNGSNDLENFWRVAKIVIDPDANEAYIADGYGNRRIIVLDATTGAYKRHWGAYGNTPDDAEVPVYDPDAAPSEHFNTVHCAELSRDGFVYVCDRVNDRIQVFRKDGTFVREVFLDKNTLRSGSVWDMTVSKDPEQTWLFVADGVNEKIRILRRDTLELLTEFGDGGRQPGQFFGVHNLDTDSSGNLYTTETYTGARVQRFIYKGVGDVPAKQGVTWPVSP